MSALLALIGSVSARARGEIGGMAELFLQKITNRPWNKAYLCENCELCKNCFAKNSLNLGILIWLIVAWSVASLFNRKF